MNSNDLNTLHELLMEFQNGVLSGEIGDEDDRTITQAIYIVEEYL